MKAVIQRVKNASVTVDDKIVGSCNAGYMILFGAIEGDTVEDISLLARKVSALRIFRDEEGKMNKSKIFVNNY